MQTASNTVQNKFDVVIVGAGMSGLYMLHRLRQSGFNALVLEAGHDVGGTWFWNRYPGARCDIQSLDYQFSFDPELEDEWEWSEKYATQPEILRYLHHVADRYQLRPYVQFNSRVKNTKWNDEQKQWSITTETGQQYQAQFCVMATGCLSMPKKIDIPGADTFKGESYSTGLWPEEEIDFTNKRVAVIGTGSSGIQSIPLIAKQAKEVIIFQRTPNFSMPAGNGPIPEKKRKAVKSDRAAYRKAARLSSGGVPVDKVKEGALDVSNEERESRYETVWQKGELFAPIEAFKDLLLSPEANDTFADFVREKIRNTVKDPDVAKLLSPTTYPIGTKRPCLDTDYYQTFNLPHVRLVDLRTKAIKAVTETGITFGDESIDVDVIVFATGFDAVTGALSAIDIQGRNNKTLKEKWRDGPISYLGLMSADFPNLFTITGPGSPSVLSNMVVSIEQHVEWIDQCINFLRENQFNCIEATPTAETGWANHVNDCANLTLYPLADSWLVGANVPGKPRVFLPYVGGVGTYREICDKVVADNYLGFKLSGESNEQCNDGVINRLQPDVAVLVQMVADANLPAMESLSPEEARELSKNLAKNNPPGPEVGEVTDGLLPIGDAKLNYRLYKPESKDDENSDNNLIIYFHGGGWVLGSEDSDDPFCRDLCKRTNTAIISVNYRHAPEHRFPTAANDAYAATCWIAEHANELGIAANKIILAGWSAGGNLATVTCQQIRDKGGPNIVGQLLIAPVTDYNFERASYQENAEGYILTTELMKWFWDQYTDEEQRFDPKASPLRASSLANLPPAAIFTCEFDPLRDEGQVYAKALNEAGVKAKHYFCRGHLHTTPLAVDIIPSSAPIREQMATAVSEFLK